jgi:hypothetical protein
MYHCDGGLVGEEVEGIETVTYHVSKGYRTPTAASKREGGMHRSMYARFILWLASERRPAYHDERRALAKGAGHDTCLSSALGLLRRNLIRTT